MRRYLAGAGVFLLLAVPAMADLSTGVAAYRRGDYTTALAQLLSAAEAGSAEAAYYVGRIYLRGEGIDPDPARAAGWYRRAAERGHTLSQNNLGVLFESGRGVARDDAAAARWYREAADAGLAVAQANLATLYAEGRGVAQNDALAAQWWRRAARQGHAPSQLKLGLALRDGRGVEADAKEAERWLRKAGKQGFVAEDPAPGPGLEGAASAPVSPGQAGPPAVAPTPGASDPESAPVAAAPESEAGHAVPGDPTLAELTLQANAGDIEAQFRLAEAYERGVATAGERSDQALRWYLTAAERGHPMAGYRLAFLHLRGRGPTGREDYVQAYVWFELGAERGVGDSRIWLERIRPKMTEEEIARAETLVAEWRARLPAEDRP